MSEAHVYKSVTFWSAFAGLTLAVCASIASLLAGGLSLTTIMAFACGPLLVWVVFGRREAWGAVSASVTGMAGLILLQINGALPPPVLKATDVAIASALFFLVIYAVSVILRYEKAMKPSAQSEVRATDPADTVMPLNAVTWLMVEVSSLGRVRRREGSSEILPAATVGRVAGEVLIDATGIELTAGLHKLTDKNTFFVDHQKSGDGEVFLILPETSFPMTHNDAADQKLRDRTNFFAGLGHDLKSPLNAIIGFSDLMDEEVRGPMPEPYQEYPGLIKESGQTLLRLVEDMLGYARSEAGTYELDIAPLDVAASAKAVLRQSKADADRANVKLVLKAKGEVLAMADARAVQRIWDNLVSNAIKYSHPGGTVTLTARERSDGVVISVADEGVGMDAEDLNRIAAPFEQGRNARGKAGTGLGLAMVKRLADMHKGRMIMRTAPGEGTQISIMLPLAAKRDSRAAE